MDDIIPKDWRSKIAGAWFELHSDDRGVSSVIGVVLMVGVVTILGGIIGAAVLGIDINSWVTTAEEILDMDNAAQP
ncbi:type IV pilin [Halolamina sp. C58]|uniref:type IV pilin n=1 Tax=Halolamina sp. C58 TaxID=3421640 RepID=UPI003EBF187F